MSEIKIGAKVRVKTGRNSGEVGVVKHLNENGTVAYVDFDRYILVTEWGSRDGDMYPDGYWIAVDYVTAV